MNRSERRKQTKNRKGGSSVSISKEQSYSPSLDYAVKYGKKLDKEKTNRSKQVPGF